MPTNGWLRVKGAKYFGKSRYIDFLKAENCMFKSFGKSLLALAVIMLCAVPLSSAQHNLPAGIIETFGQPPATPDGRLPQPIADAVRAAFVESVAPIGSETQIIWGTRQDEALTTIAGSGDPRLGWLIADLMRFIWQPDISEKLADAAGELLGKNWGAGDPWNQIIDHLIAWEMPAPPDYLARKKTIYTTLLHGWERLFIEGDIDWRHVTWGGVPIDARAFGQTDIPCPCIPAADNPPVTSADEATWLEDDAIVFGIVINGEARAYPRQIMEVREMVNDTLGGRDLGIPYCTLCGAAQAYFTDDMPPGIERPILRTSGLLIRSNKVMFDLNTYSIFDTFKGKALTGPLAEAGLQLKQATVVTSNWASWRQAHPQTTVLAEELALGRDFNFREGRDADGPIFPIGDVDPRLPVQDDVVGVITPSGNPVAFPRGAALIALNGGNTVALDGVALRQSAGGLRAFDLSGREIAAHQAFWFAWSQFYPDTKLWEG
ncbi:MAG: DUF3179 domain-containing (seleno)protein [Pseudomonadota bacterium]